MPLGLAKLLLFERAFLCSSTAFSLFARSSAGFVCAVMLYVSCDEKKKLFWYLKKCINISVKNGSLARSLTHLLLVHARVDHLLLLLLWLLHPELLLLRLLHPELLLLLLWLLL